MARLLLVEDDTGVAELLALALSSLGHQTVIAGDGASGLTRGVPDDLREFVFDRFVRGDASRHGTGSGLGLAIAREDARLLRGDLTLDADGRTFRLSLPL